MVDAWGKRQSAPAKSAGRPVLADRDGGAARGGIEAEIVVAGEMDHGALGERGDGQKRIDADRARDHRAVADIEPAMDAAGAIEHLAFMIDHAA